MIWNKQIRIISRSDKYNTYSHSHITTIITTSTHTQLLRVVALA